MTELSAELTDIQAKLMQLEQERGVRAASVDDPGTAESSVGLPDWLSAMLDEEGELDPDAVIAVLREGGNEWLEGFNEDLASVRPSSLLAIFALGVLAGKLS